MSLTQATLDGSETEEEYNRPNTLVYCHDCKKFILRSKRTDHWTHEVTDSPLDKVDESGAFEVTTGIEDDEDEPAREVGSKYSVTLSYSVDYRFTVYAWDSSEAKRRAKEMAWDATPVDQMHVHTDMHEIETIYEDDDRAEEHDLLP